MRKASAFRLCVCGDLSGAGAARAERQHLGSGLQRDGPLAHPAHDAAGASGTAFTGLVPVLAPLHGVLSVLSAALTGLLDRWAVWIAAKPGAGLYFDTTYAAIVCLVLILLCWLAFRSRLRLRVAVPCIVLTAAVSVGLGNALSRDVVHIDLVGSANAPAVVVTQNDTAVVLFRGGNSVRNAVEEQLARRGAAKIELLVDLQHKTGKRPVRWKRNRAFWQKKCL